MVYLCRFELPCVYCCNCSLRVVAVVAGFLYVVTCVFVVVAFCWCSLRLSVVYLFACGLLITAALLPVAGPRGVSVVRWSHK